MSVATEQVLVVKREDMFPDGAWHGFVTENLERHQKTIRDKHFFKPRAEVENDPTFQQIIPYVVFRHDDRYLLTHRLRASSEKRLRKQYSLGVGGHINPGDLEGGDPILDGLKREWSEEVVYEGRFEAKLLGLLNEESSPVSMCRRIGAEPASGASIQWETRSGVNRSGKGAAPGRPVPVGASRKRPAA